MSNLWLIAWSRFRRSERRSSRRLSSPDSRSCMARYSEMMDCSSSFLTKFYRPKSASNISHGHCRSRPVTWFSKKCSQLTIWTKLLGHASFTGPKIGYTTRSGNMSTSPCRILSSSWRKTSPTRASWLQLKGRKTVKMSFQYSGSWTVSFGTRSTQMKRLSPFMQASNRKLLFPLERSPTGLKICVSSNWPQQSSEPRPSVPCLWITLMHWVSKKAH